MADATPGTGFARPDLTTFARLDDLGLEVTGQRVEPGCAVLACRVMAPDRWCRRCGVEGRPRDSVVRRLAHEPLGWRPTTLLVKVARYRCESCQHVWRQDTSKAAPARSKLSRRGLRWALEGLVLAHLSMTRVAAGLGVAWSTANDAVLAEGQRLLIDNPAGLDGVTALGVDEHVWRHTRRGDKYVTVIIDLTAVRAGTGPARLLDMVEGRGRIKGARRVLAAYLMPGPFDKVTSEEPDYCRRLLLHLATFGHLYRGSGLVRSLRSEAEAYWQELCRVVPWSHVGRSQGPARSKNHLQTGSVVIPSVSSEVSRTKLVGSGRP